MMIGPRRAALSRFWGGSGFGDWLVWRGVELEPAGHVEVRRVQVGGIEFRCRGAGYWSTAAGRWWLDLWG